MALRVQYHPRTRITQVWQEESPLNFAAPSAAFDLDPWYWPPPNHTFMPHASIWFGGDSEGGLVLGGFRLEDDPYLFPGVTPCPTSTWVSIEFEQLAGIESRTFLDEESWVPQLTQALPTSWPVVVGTDERDFTFLAGPFKYRKTLSEEGTGVGKRQKHIGEIGDTRDTV